MSPMSRLAASFFSVGILVLHVSVAHAHAPASAVPPKVIDIVDVDARHDATNMSLVVTNIGSLGFDLVNGAAGLEFPIGSGNTALFAAGLWVGATVAGQT